MKIINMKKEKESEEKIKDEYLEFI